MFSIRAVTPSVRHTVAVLTVASAVLAACTSAPPDRPSRALEARDGASSTPRPDYLGRARDYVAGLDLDDKAGQVIVAGYSGKRAPTRLIEQERVGGVIVMGYNVESPSQVRRVNATLRRAWDRPWPMLSGVDQEGGEITRITAPLTEFPSYMGLGATRDPRLASEVATASGRELRGLGFTAVFAPDADVTIGPQDPTIGSRSAGSDPDNVARIVRGSIDGYERAGIVPVPKHFPGHGSVRSDSHVDLPVQRAGEGRLESRDLVPFKASIDDRTPAMMIAHIDVQALDPGVPSSLSSRVVQDWLRGRLGFEGTVFTDGLHMGALTERYGVDEIGVRALAAGADVLLMPADAAATRRGIVRAVRGGELDESRLDEAATRMIAMQLEQRDRARMPVAAAGSARELAYRTSLAALTVVDGPCDGRLVGDAIRIVGGRPADRVRLTAAARAAGLSVEPGGDVVRLLLNGRESGNGDVVVSLNSPYGLADSEASRARLALFGRTPESYRALVDVLTGRATGKGRLPVPVDGVRPGQGC